MGYAGHSLAEQCGSLQYSGTNSAINTLSSLVSIVQSDSVSVVASTMGLGPQLKAHACHGDTDN